MRPDWNVPREASEPPIGGRIGIQDLHLHPTGAFDADRSGGRQQEDQAERASIVVEQALQLIDIVQV
jgi:hypothetical protein